MLLIKSKYKSFPGLSVAPIGATLNPGKDLYFDLISNMSKSFKGC